MTPIDDLIASLGYSHAPISKWQGRHGSEFLQCLIKAYKAYPDIFEPYTNKVLKYANYWSLEKRQPIVGMTNINRRGSFLGGFPWTSAAHPWPIDRNGDALAPILQLNLAELPLGPIDVQQDVLFQVWGWDGTGELYPRSLPLVDLNGEPNWTLSAWKSNDLYYHFEGFKGEDGWTTPTELDWYDGRVVGEYVSPDKQWHFSLGRDLDLVFGYGEDLLPEGPLPEGAEPYWRSLQSLAETAPQMSASTYSDNDVMSGYFGGQMYAHTNDYADFPEYAALYCPKEMGDIGDDGDCGLFAWYDSGFDGKLSILQERSGQGALIPYTD